MCEFLNFVLHQVVGIGIFLALWSWYVKAGEPKNK
jgi:hypothetical protein